MSVGIFEDILGPSDSYWRNMHDDVRAGIVTPTADYIAWCARQKLEPWGDYIGNGAYATADEEEAAHDRATDPDPNTYALDRFRKGGTFVLDEPQDVPAVWGHGDEILWAAGEPLIICGPTGVGKTTLGMQLVAGRLGLTGDVLGMPVQPDPRRTLYLAMDRPRQIARAMGRLFTADQRDILDERLVVWPGPLPADLGRKPETLLWLANLVDAGTIVIDSLKDAAVKLTDDEAGGNLNRAIQTAIVEGIEVSSLHHQRKGQGGVRPNTLEDVYGSTWLTAGAGSVVLLWGAAGDALVELHHLKQPGAEVGPLHIEHNHITGRSTVERGFDPLVFLRHRQYGATATDAAKAMTEKDRPTDNERKKAQRKLERLVAKGLARREEPELGGPEGTKPARYHAVNDDPSSLVEGF